MKPWVILDILVVAVFVINAVTGLRRGLMRAFVGMASFVVSGIAVFMLVTPVTAYMMQTQVPDMVRERVAPVIVNVFDTARGTITIEETLEKAGMPDFVIDFVEKSTNTEQAEKAFVETLTESAVGGIVKIFSILVIFVGIQIVLSIIIWIVSSVLKGTSLGGFNRMLGAIIGVANAMIIVYLLCAMVMLLSPIMDLSSITELIQKTFITKCFYNNNVLMGIFC